MNEYTPEKPIVNKIQIQSKYKLIAYHLHCIERGIDFYSSKHDSFIVLGGLNTEISNSFLKQVCVA